MHFGAGLRLLRTEAGYSLRALASAVGVSTAYLSRVEHGHDPPPTADRLRAIAGVLEIPVEVLLEFSGRSVTPASAGVALAQRQLLSEIEHRRLGPAQVARVLEFVVREFPLKEDNDRPSLLSMLPRERVLLGVQVGCLEDALDLAALRLAPPREVGALAEALRVREREQPSAVGAGLVIPHLAGFSAEPRAVLVVLETPRPLPTPDGVAVRVLLVLIGLGSRALLMLARAARLAEGEIVAGLGAAADVEAVLGLIGRVDRG